MLPVCVGNVDPSLLEALTKVRRIWKKSLSTTQGCDALRFGPNWRSACDFGVAVHVGAHSYS